MKFFREQKKKCSRNFFGKWTNMIAYFDRIGIINVYALIAPCTHVQGPVAFVGG